MAFWAVLIVPGFLWGTICCHFFSPSLSNLGSQISLRDFHSSFSNLSASFSSSWFLNFSLTFPAVPPAYSQCPAFVACFPAIVWLLCSSFPFISTPSLLLPSAQVRHLRVDASWTTLIWVVFSETDICICDPSPRPSHPPAIYHMAFPPSQPEELSNSYIFLEMKFSPDGLSKAPKQGQSLCIPSKVLGRG